MTLITLRKGTSSQWSSSNPVLATGEPGYDLTNKILKIGDGINYWYNLTVYGSNLFAAISHSHLSADISNFNSSVSGLFSPIANSGANRIAVSDGSPYGLTAHTGLTFDGSLLYTSSGNFFKSLQVNGTGVSLSGHTHTSSSISDFNNAFSGLLPSISNSGNYRIPVNNGNPYQLVAHTGLTFNGALLSCISGNFYKSLQINSTGVSLNGHTHTSSDITNFNTSVSGLLKVKDIVASTGIYISSNNGTYSIAVTGSISNGGGGGGGGATILNYGNHRILTSDGTQGNIYANSDFVYLSTPSGSQLGIGTTNPNGNLSLSNGYFTNTGDSQKTFLTVRALTINNNTVKLLHNGTSGNIIIPEKTVWNFNISLACYSDTNGGVGSWNFRGCAKRLDNTNPVSVYLVGNIIEEKFIDSSISGVGVSVSGNNTNKSLDISVTGLDSHTIRWTAGVEFTQTSFGTIYAYPMSYASKNVVIEWC